MASNADKEAGSLAAVIFAAGLSRRLGYPKQLCSFQGQTLLERALACLKEPSLEISSIYLLTGAAKDACWSLARESFPAIKEIFNPAYPEGLGSSIRCAAQHLNSLRERPAAALFLTCDQLFLTPEHLLRLVSASREATGPTYRLTASAYQDTVGIPAIFPEVFWEELTSLAAGARGAKAILMASQDLVRVPFPRGEIDLDTPDEMDRFGISFDAARFAGLY